MQNHVIRNNAEVPVRCAEVGLGRDSDLDSDGADDEHHGMGHGMASAQMARQLSIHRSFHHQRTPLR